MLALNENSLWFDCKQLLSFTLDDKNEWDAVGTPLKQDTYLTERDVGDCEVGQRRQIEFFLLLGCHR